MDNLFGVINERLCTTCVCVDICVLLSFLKRLSYVLLRCVDAVCGNNKNSGDDDENSGDGNGGSANNNNGETKFVDLGQSKPFVG